MKTKKLLLLFLAGIFISQNASSQEVCGTAMPTNYQKYESSSNTSRTYEEPACINVYFHIIRDSNGSGGINSNQLDAVTNNLNQFYNTFDIYFSNIGFDYINNSNYIQTSENEAPVLGQINNRSNAINIYIVNELWNVGNGSVTGTALSIPSNRLIIRQDRVLTSTAPHEIGHCLNLLHTFETAYCTEAINGSNCTSCGDQVCDTPADANNGNSGGYTPDLTNIMSYYSVRNHFTNGQSTRMKAAIANSSLLQQVIGTSCLVPKLNGPDLICNTIGTNYSILNGGNNVVWSVSSNLTILSSSSSTINVKPTNSSTNGAGYIEAVLLNQTIRKEIWIGKPLITVNLNPTGINYVNVDMVGANGSSINNQGITATTWQKVSSSGGCTASFGGSGFGALGHGNCNSWSVYAKITATNSCGTTTIYRTITPPAPAPCDRSYKISKTFNNNYEVMKIIEPCRIAYEDSKIEKINNSEKITILVYDIFGNTIIKTNENKINLEDQKMGLYIIKAFINNEILTYKVIR